jgi:hypothetical protein
MSRVRDDGVARPVHRSGDSCDTTRAGPRARSTAAGATASARPRRTLVCWCVPTIYLASSCGQVYTRRRVRGHACVLGAAAAGSPDLRDSHRVVAGHCAGRGRAALE